MSDRYSKNFFLFLVRMKQKRIHSLARKGKRATAMIKSLTIWRLSFLVHSLCNKVSIPSPMAYVARLLFGLAAAPLRSNKDS